MNKNTDIELMIDEIKELILLIDNFEIQIINNNKLNNEAIDKYNTMMDNIILDYHTICKKIFNN